MTLETTELLLIAATTGFGMVLVALAIYFGLRSGGGPRQ